MPEAHAWDGPPENHYRIHFYHTDHLGSTRLVTEAFGQIIEIIDYLPFGEIFRDSYPWDESDLYERHREKYTGQMYDYLTGLYYYGARYYDPEIGRFTQSDTIVPRPLDGQTFNRYTYSNNNPYKYNDPSGHSAGVTGFILGGLLGAIGLIVGAVIGFCVGGIGGIIPGALAYGAYGFNLGSSIGFASDVANSGPVPEAPGVEPGNTEAGTKQKIRGMSDFLKDFKAGDLVPLDFLGDSDNDPYLVAGGDETWIKWIFDTLGSIGTKRVPNVIPPPDDPEQVQNAETAYCAAWNRICGNVSSIKEANPKWTPNDIISEAMTMEPRGNMAHTMPHYLDLCPSLNVDFNACKSLQTNDPVLFKYLHDYSITKPNTFQQDKGWYTNPDNYPWIQKLREIWP